MLHLFKHLISNRKKQLDTQKDIDDLLKTARNKCPQSLIDFFLLERAFNRKQCIEVENSNIWEYPEIISKNMSVLEKRNNEMLLSIKSINICSVLENHTRELNKNLN